MNLVGVTPFDMIRYKFYIQKHCAEKLVRRLALHPAIQYWRCNDVRYYVNNFRIPYGDSAFYMGIERIEDRKGSNKFSAVIEFNPNKTIFISTDAQAFFEYFESDIFRFDFDSIVWWRGLLVSSLVALLEDKAEIKYVHYCYDVDAKIDNIVSLRSHRNRKIFETKTGKTIYIGENFLKIYDKSAEAGLTDRDIVRFEVKIDLNCKKSDVTFEDVYTSSYVFDDLAGVEGALVYAIMNGYDINKLNWKWKDKIKKYLQQNSREVVIRGADIQADFYSFLKHIDDFVSILLKIKY